MAYKVIILYQLYMPSYFLGTFTEYPEKNLLNCRFSFFLSVSVFMPSALRAKGKGKKY